MSLFIPDYYSSDLTTVDWSCFYARGIRATFFDLDNTLELQGTILPGPRSRCIIQRCRAAQIEPVLVSNARSARGRQFAETLGIAYLGSAGKPFPGKLMALLREMDLRPESGLMVGDQVFTDLLVARFSGMPAMLQRPLPGQEAWYVRLKRALEAFLRFLGQDPRRAPAAPCCAGDCDEKGGEA